MPLTNELGMLCSKVLDVKSKLFELTHALIDTKAQLISLRTTIAENHPYPELLNPLDKAIKGVTEARNKLFDPNNYKEDEKCQQQNN